MKRHVMVEDLTSTTYSLLKALQDPTGVAKAWTIEGQIRFARADKPDTVVKVKSIYEHVDKIVRDLKA